MSTIPQAIGRYLKLVLAAVVGGLLTLFVVGIWYLNSRQDLSLWHTVKLDREFTAASGISSLEEYLAQEEQLFLQLDEEVYQATGPADEHRYDRYYRGSRADPSIWGHNWNRTYQLAVDEPVAAVLLLHGMSDSPYSLRTLGATLNSAGSYVLGLRLPGHGTAPVGLTAISADDLAAAVDLSVRHLRQEVGDRPLYIVGYSNGGSLAVDYALRSISDDSLPKVDGIVLASPAIGVTGAAAYAVWQARLGRWLGLPKLEWQSLGPEYDPFKYISFAVNAGDVVYQMTQRIRLRLDRLSDSGGLAELPPILAFQSIVDSTVSTAAVTEDLFARLSGGRHELVIFDVDRSVAVEGLLADGMDPPTLTSIHGADQPFTITAISNRSPATQEVAVYRSVPGSAEVTVEPLGLKWPPGVYSLSHVAMVFPASDPLYGAGRPRNSPAVFLGNLDLRGEKGIFRIPASAMLRQRWNPFYPYLEGRVLEFMSLPPCDGRSATVCSTSSP